MYTYMERMDEKNMRDYCAFSKDHKCPKWIDYQQTRQELEEADEVCQGNWIEIEHLQRYQLIIEDLYLQKNFHTLPLPANHFFKRFLPSSLFSALCLVSILFRIR